MDRHSRLAGVVIAALFASAATGCSRASEELQRVQRAVGTGAQAALAARPDEPAVPTDAAPASQVPVPEVALDGSLRFTPDANHRNITGARSAAGFVVAWTDAPLSAVYVGLLDGERHAHGQGTRLHTVVSDEETLAAPAVVVTPDGSAIAWADRDNGRIRFARIDAHGALRGTVAIVHDGVDAPRSVALGWNGREYGVAVALREGVYFARVGVDGARIGDAQVIAEGEAVHSLDAVAWDGRAFDLAFTVRHDGRHERVRARIARSDRRG
jgi:hypothetical protein